ncbi:MAG: hypothetical protein IJ639_03275 [Ruminococcus sp.]|nr:hypothetical protein [Ruminococcus sp.]
MNSNTFTDKAKAIIKKPWREVTKDDLEYLYLDQDYLRTQIADAFDITVKQLEYKLKKFGISKQKRWMHDALLYVIEKATDNTDDDFDALSRKYN